jgi:ABC-type phosphate transport system substrate-binding protein
MKFALCSLLVSALSATAKADESILSVHGAGTTNPSKCYWSVMEKMQARSKNPIRLTYRAVGSTTGQVEFVNNGDADAVVAFASGDIPLTEANYNAANTEVVHLPVLLGAVSFFHSVEDATGQTIAKLNLTACVISKIYTGEITQWDDQEIKDLNPNLNLPDDNGNGITVARRNNGSSSTESTTQVRRHSVHSIDLLFEWRVSCEYILDPIRRTALVVLCASR